MEHDQATDGPGALHALWVSVVPCDDRRFRREEPCAYDGRLGPVGAVRVCSAGRHRYRSTGQRWVRDPGTERRALA